MTNSQLSTQIARFGYLMDNMGRNNEKATNAHLTGDYDGRRMYSELAETYRSQAYQLKKDIDAQLGQR